MIFLLAIVSIGVTVVFLWPIAIWMHQIGHVIAMLMLTHDTVIVQWYGSPRSSLFMRVMNIGSVHFRQQHTDFISPLPWYQFFVGYRHGPDAPRWPYVCVDLAGPLFSLALTVSGAYWFWHTSDPSVRPFAAAMGILFMLPNLVALVPYRYPLWTRGCAGTLGDGQRVLLHMHGAVDPPLPLIYREPLGRFPSLRDDPQDTIAPPSVYWL